MTRVFSLAAAGLILAASWAQAEEATAPIVRVAPDAAIVAPSAPGPGVVAVPSPPSAGFAAPTLRLNFGAPGHDSVAGLGPGEDLVGNGGPGVQHLSAAELDTYFATREFQDKNATIQHKPGHESTGRQMGQLGKAMAAEGLIRGIGVLINGD